jgi:hypothetical protein
MTSFATLTTEDLLGDAKTLIKIRGHELDATVIVDFKRNDSRFIDIDALDIKDVYIMIGASFIKLDQESFKADQGLVTALTKEVMQIAEDYAKTVPEHQWNWHHEED